MNKQVAPLDTYYSLLDLEIDESKIENILAFLPEETRRVLTFEEQVELVKKVLNCDVADLFNEVMSLVNKS